MNFSFSKALDAFTKATGQAIETVREKVLPTPGKRKRDAAEENSFDEFRQRRKTEPANTTRTDSLHPESQFAEAAAPALDLSEIAKAPVAEQQGHSELQGQASAPLDTLSSALAHERSTAQAAQGAGNLPETSALSLRHLEGNPGPSQSFETPVGAVTHDGPLRPVAGSLAAWQRRYPEYSQPRMSFKDSMAVPRQMQFSPSKGPRQRSGFRPGAPLLLTKSYKLSRQKAQQHQIPLSRRDWKERETLRLLTKEWESKKPALANQKERPKLDDVIDLEASSQTFRPDWQRPPTGGDSQDMLQQYPWLQGQQPLKTQSQAPSLALAAAEYQLEKSQQQRLAEKIQEDIRSAKQDIADLMGDRQARLLARVSQALGETSKAIRPRSGTVQRNAAAEISKASMSLAKDRAAALASSLSEVQALEQQQERLQSQRWAQQEALRAAHSGNRPDEKTNGWQSTGDELRSTSAKEQAMPSKELKVVTAKPRKQAVDVVDLLSSSEEGDAPDEEDEAATMHGEISPRDASQEEEVSYTDEDEEEEVDDEEADVRARLVDVSVTDEAPPGFPALTKHQLRQHQDALESKAHQSVELKVHKSSNIGVTRGLLACLKSRQWLNDEVMNLFMGLLQDRDKVQRKSKGHLKCHFCSTFFFNKLYLDQRSYDYDAVSRWTRPKRLRSSGQESASILDCDRVIAPVHLGVHWTCAMADIANREFLYFDSMGGRNKEVMESLRKYIADEYRDKKQQEVDTSKWKIRYNPGSVPVQTNGCDCGVFALTFAEHLSRGAPLGYSQDHMEYFRKLIAASIMDLQLPASEQ